MRRILTTIGDVRIKEKFLIFPKTIDNELRWFERARWEERYLTIVLSIDLQHGIGTEILFDGWKPVAWLEPLDHCDKHRKIYMEL